VLGRLGLYQFLRPLAVGLVHGLAGSAAVALLVLAEIRDPRWAIVYLLIFGVGTIAGMMLITMAIGAPFAYTGRRFAPFNRGLGVASGLLSLGFGLFITYQIAITDGLFRHTSSLGRRTRRMTAKKRLKSHQAARRKRTPMPRPRSKRTRCH